MSDGLLSAFGKVLNATTDLAMQDINRLKAEIAKLKADRARLAEILGPKFQQRAVADFIRFKEHGEVAMFVNLAEARELEALLGERP